MAIVKVERKDSSITYRVGGINAKWKTKRGLIGDILKELKIYKPKYYAGLKSGLKTFTVKAVDRNGESITRPALEIKNPNWGK